jgi:hypothetical protein
MTATTTAPTEVLHLSPEEATNLVDATQMNPTAKIEFDTGFDGFVITKPSEKIEVRVIY